MPTGKHSLLAGRNKSPLSDNDVRRAQAVFQGMDRLVNARYAQNSKTYFHVEVDDSGEEYGEIVFGPDIYPGPSLVDPNSALSLKGAVAHELTHYHRWHDKTHLLDPNCEHLDEAMTSLEAIARYERHLDEHDVRQLVNDAMQRIQLYLLELPVKS